MTVFARWIFVVLLSQSLVACSTVKGWFEMDDDEDPTQPVALVDIETSVKVRKLWSVGVGNGQGDGFYKIQPVIEGDMIYAASADGEVVAVNRSTGRKAWDTDLETGRDYSVSAEVRSADGELLFISDTVHPYQPGDDGITVELVAT